MGFERGRNKRNPILMFYIYIKPNSRLCFHDGVATCNKGPAAPLNKEPLCLAPHLPTGELMLHQHRVFSRDSPSACGPEVKHFWLWNWEEEEGGSASHHSTYTNDTLTPAGRNEWKCKSAILKHAPLFPCFRTDQLWRRCRKCLWLPETAD